MGNPRKKMAISNTILIKEINRILLFNGIEKAN